MRVERRGPYRKLEYRRNFQCKDCGSALSEWSSCLVLEKGDKSKIRFTCPVCKETNRMVATNPSSFSRTVPSPKQKKYGKASIPWEFVLVMVPLVVLLVLGGLFAVNFI